MQGGQKRATVENGNRQQNNQAQWFFPEVMVPELPKLN